MPIPHLALLVVDAQPAFLEAVADSAAVADSCRFAVAAAVALDIPVLFSEQRPEKLGRTRKDILAAAPGAPVFAKSAFSAFGEQGVPEWLREREISHLLVAGVEASVCVYRTVVDAMSEGVEVTVLTDAVGSRRPADREAALRALEKKTDCHLLPSETVFYSILADSSHAAFREISALVKARDAGGAPSVAKPGPKLAPDSAKSSAGATRTKLPQGKQRG